MSNLLLLFRAIIEIRSDAIVVWIDSFEEAEFLAIDLRGIPIFKLGANEDEAGRVGNGVTELPGAANSVMAIWPIRSGDRDQPGGKVRPIPPTILLNGDTTPIHVNHRKAPRFAYPIASGQPHHSPTVSKEPVGAGDL
jgi:hypothetical protein